MAEKMTNLLRLDSIPGTYRVVGVSILKTISFILGPLYFLLLLVYFEAFSPEVNELILQLCALVILLLGLPLSAGFRVDQLSLELGANFSRVVVLLIASLFTWLNLALILGFRAWVRSSKKN